MRRKTMFGSIQKWWGAAALAFLSIAPGALASSMLTMPSAEINVIHHPVYTCSYATMDGLRSRVICDDFAREAHIGKSWNFTPNPFTSLGSALWGKQGQNAPLKGLNSLGMENWLGILPSNFEAGQFSNFAILTPQGCPTGLGSCRVSAPEGGSDATYLLMAALSCFAAILLRRRRQAVSA
jgi:MYXO-CTERM domain-containing protein